MNPPLRRMSLFFVLAMMFFLFFLNISVVSYVCLYLLQPLFGVENPTNVAQGILNTSTEVNAFLFYQALSSIGGFVLTAVLITKLETGQIFSSLRFNRMPALRLLLLGIVAILVAQFFIEFLVTVNQHLPLSSKILDEIKKYQEQIEKLTNQLMEGKSFAKFLAVSFVVAVVPAIGEEMFFRGMLLGTLLRRKVHPAAAIILSGLCFALAHFEFTNTLAIWVLGSFLGYLYYVSGSLWLPVAAHFTNNFLSVLLKYLYNIGVISSDVTDSATPWYATLASVVLFLGCLFLFNKWKERFDTGEEDDNNENELPNNENVLDTP
jgi:membrane protease YdiL (CAAX protease family)